MAAATVRAVAKLHSAAEQMQPDSARSFIDSLDQLRDTVLELSPPKQHRRKRRQDGEPASTSRTKYDGEFTQRTNCSARSSARGSARGSTQHSTRVRRKARDGVDGVASTARASAREVLAARSAAQLARIKPEVVPPSEMWLHCQTIPGFIGGNPFLSRSKVPMAGTETGHCHWGDALMLQPSDYSRKARRHEADFSTEERAENWRDHDHFNKKAHAYTKYNTADARNNCLSAFNRR